jgi:AcrR family transcriptional regulator
MTGVWGREDQPDLAVEKILDAAEKAFVELGVSAAGMAEIASFAGCSRGTLYRYFKNRHELHLAYVKRASLAIQRSVHERVDAIEDAEQRMVEFILCTIQEVRGNPATAAWFAPGASGLAARMSRSAEVVETLTGSVVPEEAGTTDDGVDLPLRQRWLVRIVVSLLTDPGESEAQERRLVERFVVPVVFADARR